MKKTLTGILLLMGAFLSFRWDDIKVPLTTLENRILVSLGLADVDPPVGYYILTERTAVKTGGGVRVVQSGTEVRLISRQNTTANVDDGISSFEVLNSKLSRAPGLRTGPRYHDKGIASTGKEPLKSTEPAAKGISDQKTRLSARIKAIDDKLLELTVNLRDLSMSDLQNGQIQKSAETIREWRKQIAAYELERSYLKKEMHTVP